MNNDNDRVLGMTRRISRRDFINGVARTAAAMSFLPGWLQAVEAEQEEVYPPALTGLRGSNEGSFEIAHQLKEGKLWTSLPEALDTKEVYDLVVVGAGVSGLSAAWFFRKAIGPQARILILDNHDDFGGHARRQEFTRTGSPLVTFGGSYAIESPAPYSQTAKSLLVELGVDVGTFRKYMQEDPYRGLTGGIFFDRNTFGVDRLLADPHQENYVGAAAITEEAWEQFLAKAPLPEKSKLDLLRIQKEQTDFFPGLSSDEKKRKLAQISYADFLTKVAKCDPALLPFFQSRLHSLYGAGMDAIPAQDAWGLGFPGFDGMHLEDKPGAGMNRDAIPDEEAQKFFFHFPDGNASIARMLVRKLVPAAIPGSSSEDIVTARAKYSKLDVAGSPARIRLSSTVVKVEHKTEREIEITYARNKKLERVRASSCVLACWHTMIPYLCPELSREQKTALAYAIKVPLVYAKAAVRNWIPWEKLGIRAVYAPGSYYSSAHLSMALRIGSYQTTQKSAEPVVINLFRAPCRPGLPIRNQHRIGRAELLNTDFETYERNLRGLLQTILGPAGFDSARDITAIAVHRWPHGYAYQYNSLYDPFWLQGSETPCVAARRPFGRIAIANSDAGAYAYLDSAIDQAHRAIQELLSA